MKSLIKVKWKEFKVKEIFPRIEKGKCGNVGLLSNGNIPYIGATNKNNGVMNFVNAPNNLITKGNCIVFICDGQGSVGYSIYKKEDFVGSTTLKVGRHQNLNKYNAKFITSSLDRNREIYSYGYKRTEIRLKNETIILPVNSELEPDWQLMEEYIKEKELKLKEKYKKYIQNRVNKLEKFIDEEKDWKEFSIVDLFIPQKGNQNNMLSLSEGKIPLVSAKKINNGFKAFVSKNNKSLFPAHCLTINNDGDGGAGITYYQPAKMALDSHVTALIPKRKTIGKYALLYISNTITTQRNKFGHGYSINNARLRVLKFMLPINSKKEPDYEYMENYMKYLEQQKILKYLKMCN